MIVPLVEKKVGAVSIDVEAFTKLVWPETVSAPPKYTLPEEWTERREPGVVVPAPTKPVVVLTKKVGVTAVPTLKSPQTSSLEAGVVVPMPT